MEKFLRTAILVLTAVILALSVYILAIDIPSTWSPGDGPSDIINNRGTARAAPGGG